MLGGFLGLVSLISSLGYRLVGLIRGVTRDSKQTYEVTRSCKYRAQDIVIPIISFCANSRPQALNSMYPPLSLHPGHTLKP